MPLVLIDWPYIYLLFKVLMLKTFILNLIIGLVISGAEFISKNIAIDFFE